jgi:serine/threonine protein kinase
LSLQEVKSAIKSVLTCLNYLHSNGFVHRDIRWANLIRQYYFHEDGSVESCRFLVIDFEFAERDGEDMLINNYMFAHVVPYGQSYHSRHDLILVGKLVKVWANYNSKQLDTDANDFISMLNQHNSNASNALTHIWLQD